VRVIRLQITIKINVICGSSSIYSWKCVQPHRVQSNDKVFLVFFWEPVREDKGIQVADDHDLRLFLFFGQQSKTDSMKSLWYHFVGHWYLLKISFGRPLKMPWQTNEQTAFVSTRRKCTRVMDNRRQLYCRLQKWKLQSTVGTFQLQTPINKRDDLILSSNSE